MFKNLFSRKGQAELPQKEPPLDNVTPQAQEGAALQVENDNLGYEKPDFQVLRQTSKSLQEALQAIENYQQQHRKIAVFIDGDNVKSELVEFAFEELEKRGQIRLVRLYADAKLQAQWATVQRAYPLLELRMMSTIRGKNSVDIALTVGAMEILHKESDFDTFCIISNDRDFLPLIAQLKSCDRFVIGVGNEASKELRAAYDEFIAQKNPFEDLIKESYQKLYDERLVHFVKTGVQIQVKDLYLVYKKSVVSPLGYEEFLKQVEHLSGFSVQQKKPDAPKIIKQKASV
ncbi:MAG: NYN domain-containing protein [bacterium]|nr:NYN domain-containing protein [bacterium]